MINKKTNVFIPLITLVTIFLFQGCVAKLHRVENIYVDTRKNTEDIDIYYKLPTIKTTANTKHRQTKGGVIISVEIIPFEVNRKISRTSNVTYKNPDIPNFDVFEIKNTPVYSVSPNNIKFKIKIRNNENVPLKLSEVGFALVIDGTQWSFPTYYFSDWNKGLIITGFEKEYIIDGPQIDGLNSAKTVYLLLNGVPTSYDRAGNITRKDNFKWYFQIGNKQVTKTDKISYRYDERPIHKEKCVNCYGEGSKLERCNYCDGVGSYKNKDGKKVTCYTCKGKGKAYFKCKTCGGKGVIPQPKSIMPPIKSSVSWNGWVVHVKTTPSAAIVKTINTKTGEYKTLGSTTPCRVEWFCTSGKTCPIIIEYLGKTLKVLPYKPDGNPSNIITVDFTSGIDPIVTGGEIVN